MSQRDAAIVGIHEYPSRDVQGEVSPLQIKAASAARALEDAGLNWSDVDAIYDAGDGGGMSGLTIAEYFGLKPSVINTTSVGGSSYEFHAAHAALGSVGSTAVHASAAEDIVRGQRPTAELLRRAGEAVADAVDPLDDLRGSAEYKREMATVFTRRALEQAVARAGGTVA